VLGQAQQYGSSVSDHQHPYFFERTPGGILVR
jgi:hypothetical protein